MLARFGPQECCPIPKKSVHAGIRSNTYFLCWTPRTTVCFDGLCAPNTSGKQAKVCVVALEGSATELCSCNLKANFDHTESYMYTIREHLMSRSQHNLTSRCSVRRPERESTSLIRFRARKQANCQAAASRTKSAIGVGRSRMGGALVLIYRL